MLESQFHIFASHEAKVLDRAACENLKDEDAYQLLEHKRDQL